MTICNDASYVIMLLFCMSVIVFGAVPSAHSDEYGVELFRIGGSDNDTRELALGPDRYSQFKEDGFFVVGRSDAGRDWPYVHPGPADVWAGGRVHTYRIVAAFDELPDDGLCRLEVDLVSTHPSSSPTITCAVNDYAMAFKTPVGEGGDASIEGFPEKGREYRFSGTIPVDVLKKGVNTISLTNADGSWMVYDAVVLYGPKSLRIGDVPEIAVGDVTCPQLLTEQDNCMWRVVKANVFNAVPGRKVVLLLDNARAEIVLDGGEQTVEMTIPASDDVHDTVLEISADGKTYASKELTLKPVRKWTVYFLPHSHVDIGYTHLQEEVMHRQWDNFTEALDLIDKTAEYPLDARFKWNAEVLWPVDGLLRDGPEDLRRRFIHAVQNGDVGLDALYGSMLTGLARPEELFEFTSFAGKLRREYDVRINSAMITDVPGYVWGMVPALAKSGVRYFNPGPNHMPMLPHQGDRIGYTSEAWGDKPFWWVSPSGEERVLVWIPTHGYSWFHGWILGNIKKAGADPILGYIDELMERDFPYDMVQLRYTIGADNGPPDPDLPEFVRDWNEKYAWPRMVIATTGEMFSEFERRHGDSLPEYSGDFTPYWEDGAASSARETALNRGAAERLTQAAALWAVASPESFPVAEFDEAWRNVMLYTEHTWGAHSSISDPDSDFAKGQWAVKQRFALTADEMSRDLLERAYPRRLTEGIVTYIDVVNTSSWERDDPITVPASWKLAGDRIETVDGQTLLSQRLESGELVFIPGVVPAFGSVRFMCKNGAPVQADGVTVDGTTLSNGFVTVTVDPATGTITGLTGAEIPGNLADVDAGGLNGYYYLPGKDPNDAVPSGETSVRTGDSGPVMASLVIESEAPGCRSITREIRVWRGADHIDIIDTIDKEEVREKESVHLAFPFNIPGGEIRYDVAWGTVRPDDDQLVGGNRNVFSVQRWADVSNDQYGVTVATVDSPLMEIASPNAEAWNLQSDRPWLTSVPESQTLYFYVMNNYWHTNYRAYQEGPTTFRFSLRPHGGYQTASAKRFGMEMSRPLIPVPVEASAPDISFDTSFLGDGLMITSLKPVDNGKALLVTVFNCSDESSELVPPEKSGMWLSNPEGQDVEKMNASAVIPPHGIRIVKMPIGG